MIAVTITGSGRWPYLERTVRSFKKHVHCSEEFRFFVSDDAGYKKVNSGDGSTNETRERIVESGLFAGWYFPKIQDYGECVKWLIGKVKSDLYFHLQDDWEFLIDVDLDRLIALMRRHQDINQIRFLKRQICSKLKAEHWNKLGRLTKTNVTIDGVKLVAAPYWAMHPALCRTSFVRGVPFPTKDLKAVFKPGRWERYWLQNVFRDVDRRDLADYTSKVGTYIYGQIGDPATILHIGTEVRALMHRLRIPIESRTEKHDNIV